MKDITTVRDFIERRKTLVLSLIAHRMDCWMILRRMEYTYLQRRIQHSSTSDGCGGRGCSCIGSRPIRWGTKGTGTLFAFEDPMLKGEEEQALLRKAEANELTIAMFEQKRRLAVR